MLIYRTFVHPVLEYGAPLVFAEHLQHPLNFSDATNLHNAALSWIAATRPQPNHGILETVCGSTQLVDRFQDLGTMFVCHLHSAHITNPIRIILPEVDALPSRLLFHAPIQETFEIAIQAKLSHPHHQPPISLKSLAQQTLRKNRYKHLRPPNRLLPQFILPSALTQSLVDRTILVTNTSLRRTALAWRRNLVGLNTRCPHCNGRFTRSHITNCGLITNIPSPADYARYAHDLQQFPSLISTSYCILDSLLNHQSYHSFSTCMQSLQFLDPP